MVENSDLNVFILFSTYKGAVNVLDAYMHDERYSVKAKDASQHHKSHGNKPAFILSCSDELVGS